MRGRHLIGFVTEDADAFINSPKSHICARLETRDVDGLGDDLSPDDFVIEGMYFGRKGDGAVVRVEVEASGDE